LIEEPETGGKKDAAISTGAKKGKRTVFDRRIHNERRAFLSAASECSQIRLGDELRKRVDLLVVQAGVLDIPKFLSPSRANLRDKLDSAIIKWARDFQIETTWVIHLGWGAAIARITSGGWPQNLWPWVPEGLPSWPEWNPDREKESAYDRRVKALVAAYKREVKWARAPLRGRPSPGQGDVTEQIYQRYKWAALRVCIGLTYREIAESCNERESVSEQAVRDAVMLILRRLGLNKPNQREPLQTTRTTLELKTHT
jgi:hypothetical protein